MKLHAIKRITKIWSVVILAISSSVFAKSKAFDYKNYLASNGFSQVGDGQYYKSQTDDDGKLDLELSPYILIDLAKTKGDILQITRVSVNVERQMAILVSGQTYSKGIRVSSENLSQTVILEGGTSLSILAQHIAQKNIDNFIKKIKRNESAKLTSRRYDNSGDSVFTKIYSRGKSTNNQTLILAFAKLSDLQMIEIFGEFDCQSEKFHVSSAKGMSFENPYKQLEWANIESEKEINFGKSLNCSDSFVKARVTDRVHYVNISHLFASKILQVPGLSLVAESNEVVVAAVQYGSPAEKSGIQPGGIIESIDDLDIHEQEDRGNHSLETIEKYLNNRSLGTVSITQSLNGKRSTFELIINED